MKRLYYNFREWLSQYYFRHKKDYYVCTVCGLIEAPYFLTVDKHTSLTYDYGWHRLTHSKRWICHHCADHGFADEGEENPTTYSWSEWKQKVELSNKEIKEIIRRKDKNFIV